MEKISVFGSKLSRAVVEWYRYNIFFSKEAVFVSGLVFGHSFVENAVLSVMITFITESLLKGNLRKAAAIVNFQEGMTTFMGLVLLWLAARSSIPSTMICLFWTIVLIALGKSAEEPILIAYLADQLCEQEKNPDLEKNLDVKEKQAEARSRVWWGASWFLGATAAVFFPSDAWKDILKVSAMVMGVSYLFFLCGVPIYYCKKSEGSPLTSIFRVFKVAISKRHLGYPTNPSQYYKSDDKVPHNIPLCRWLDKAAIITSTCSPEKEEREGKLCTVEQVEEVKCLLNMVPMWSTFLVYSLVEAAESTFFLEQTKNLNRFIGDSFEVPDVSFIILRSFTRSIISSLFKRKVATRVRIVVGMVFSMFCCIAAFLVERHRLDLIYMRRLFDDTNTTIDMSIFWLVPQFFLFGIMAGLARDGLDEFLTDQLGESTARDGQTINECVLGTGKFITIFCVFLLRDWFRDSINESHLDYYYILLAGLSFVSLLFSCTVLHFYYGSRRRHRRRGSRCKLGRQSYKFSYVEAQGEELGLMGVWKRHNKFS